MWEYLSLIINAMWCRKSHRVYMGPAELPHRSQQPARPSEREQCGCVRGKGHHSSCENDQPDWYEAGGQTELKKVHLLQPGQRQDNEVKIILKWKHLRFLLIYSWRFLVCKN